MDRVDTRVSHDHKIWAVCVERICADLGRVPWIFEWTWCFWDGGIWSCIVWDNVILHPHPRWWGCAASRCSIDQATSIHSTVHAAVAADETGWWAVQPLAMIAPSTYTALGTPLCEIEITRWYIPDGDQGVHRKQAREDGGVIVKGKIEPWRSTHKSFRHHRMAVFEGFPHVGQEQDAGQVNSEIAWFSDPNPA